MNKNGAVKLRIFTNSTQEDAQVERLKKSKMYFNRNQRKFLSRKETHLRKPLESLII